MTTEVNNDKYLIFRLPGNSAAGLDHLLAELKGAIKEAVHWGRILVIEKYTMAAKHNLGYRLENLDIERHINLDKTQIYKIEGSRNIHSIHSSFRYIHAEDFNKDDYPERQVLFTQGEIEPITKEQDEQYKVIIRETHNYSYPQLYLDTLVSLYPSDEVNHLTDIVLNAMGTSLAAVKQRELIYKGVDFSSNRDIFEHAMPDNSLYYAAAHIRTYRDEGIIYDRTMKYRTNPRQLKRTISYGLNKGQRIYIMSDVHDPNYFNTLKRYFLVYQYYDFPELKALVSGDDAQPVDNMLLYSVEKNIFQHAALKVIKQAPCHKTLYICPLSKRWFSFYRLLKRLGLKKP